MEDFVDRNLFEANSALNALEFANRQITLRGDGPPAFPAPFGAQYWDLAADPKVLYRQDEAGSGGIGATWKIIDDGDDAINAVSGAVFIQDIEPTGSGNIGAKVYDDSGNVLRSAVADTDLLTVQVLAVSGHKNYVTIWAGSVEIDRAGADRIVARHDGGAQYEVTIVTDSAPEITSAVFSGDYPRSQTELKAGDRFDILIEADAEMSSIQVMDFGAAEPQIILIAPPSAQASVTITVADRGAVPQAFGARIFGVNANGSAGQPFDTDSQGNTDGSHVVTLNNIQPSFSIGSVTYPSGQMALKASESALVSVSGSDFDTVSFSSPNGELSVTDPFVMESEKAVERIAGGYNVDTPNFIVTATRAANGAEFTNQGIVAIAHDAPSVSILEPAARLRSGGNQGTSAQNHEISLIANQRLLEVPAISAPAGTLQGAMVDSGDAQTFTQDLRVHDDDDKGVFSFALTSALNLAGRAATGFTGDVDYELGGFVSRTIAVPAFSNEIDLQVQVADVSKLQAEDKDLVDMNYVVDADFREGDYNYTIVNDRQELDPNGDRLLWLDRRAIVNNTTGAATITVEETV